MHWAAARIPIVGCDMIFCMKTAQSAPAYVWDYRISDIQFQELLEGRAALGRLDGNWAALRLLEYAPYEEIVRRLGFGRLAAGWPAWRSRMRSESRKRGLDFLVQWLKDRHPELLHG